MKAIYYDCYGPPTVLTYRDVEEPSPKENEVIVKVHMAAVNPLDWHYMRGEPYIMRLSSGVLKPKQKILGADVAGTVVELGPGVSQFKVGERVFGQSTHGSFAEYETISEKALAHLPDSVSFEQAAAVPVAGQTALQGLRNHGGLEAGQHVLINGASGGVGTYAVQIAKAMGAEVTAVCSTRNMEMVRSIGADSVIDYTRGDFTQSNDLYDLILDNAANHNLGDYLRVLKPKGAWILVGYSMKLLLTVVLFGGFISKRNNKNISTFVTDTVQDDIAQLASYLESGEIKSVIDRTYPLSQTAEALDYLEQGHARGKVLISVID